MSFTQRIGNNWFLVLFLGLVFEYLIFQPLWSYYFNFTLKESYNQIWFSVAIIFLSIGCVLLLNHLLIQQGRINWRVKIVLFLTIGLLFLWLGYLHQSKTYFRIDSHFNEKVRLVKGFWVKDQYLYVLNNTECRNADKNSFYKCTGGIEPWHFPNFYRIQLKLFSILLINLLFFLVYILHRIYKKKNLIEA